MECHIIDRNITLLETMTKLERRTIVYYFVDIPNQYVSVIGSR